MAIRAGHRIFNCQPLCLGDKNDKKSHVVTITRPTRCQSAKTPDLWMETI